MASAKRETTPPATIPRLLCQQGLFSWREGRVKPAGLSAKLTRIFNVRLILCDRRTKCPANILSRTSVTVKFIEICLLVRFIYFLLGAIFPPSPKLMASRRRFPLHAFSLVELWGRAKY